MESEKLLEMQKNDNRMSKRKIEFRGLYIKFEDFYIKFEDPYIKKSTVYDLCYL